MKSIDYSINMLLENYDLHDFSEYFIGQAYSDQDITYRIHSIEIATLWYESFLDGRDGKVLTKSFAKELEYRIEGLEIVPKVAFETLMAFAANCNFAEIMDHMFMVALYSSYKLFLPEDRDLDPFDAQIDEHINKSIPHSNEGRIQYCIKFDGLKSEVAILPKEASDWTKYGDVFIFSY